MEERIEHYFDAKLTEAEKLQFEADLAANAALADDSAFYLQTRLAAQQVAHEDLLKEKHQQWSDLNKESPKSLSRNNWIGFAAAVLLIILSIFYFNNFYQKDLSLRAKKYLALNLKELPLHLSDEEQSIQEATLAYNQQKYKESITSAATYLIKHPTDAEALKVIGLAQLQLQKHDEALAYFRQLTAQTQLYSNPGKYYEALTYLLRNQPGDQETARKILNEVIEKNLEGKQDALKLLK